MVKSQQDLLKLEKIYEMYKGIMYNEARKVLRSKEDCEDAIQKTFENLIKCSDRIEDVDSARTCSFIKIATRNAAIDICKANSNVSERELSADFLEDLPSINSRDSCDIVIQKETLERTIEAIKKLPVTMRDVVILEKVLGYSRKEAMQLLGENNETLKKRLTRARKKLQSAIRKED